MPARWRRAHALRIHFIQHWFNLSGPATEKVLYNSATLRRFVGIDLGREPAPDEVMVCKFLHLMKKHNLGDHLFHLVNQHLKKNGLKVSRGTIVDARIISAPSFTRQKGSRNRKLTEKQRSRNRNKSRARAKVEHQFGIIKRQFSFSKVR